MIGDYVATKLLMPHQDGIAVGFEPLVNEVREALFGRCHVMPMSREIREPATAGTTGVFPPAKNPSPPPLRGYHKVNILNPSA